MVQTDSGIANTRSILLALPPPSASGTYGFKLGTLGKAATGRERSERRG